MREALTRLASEGLLASDGRSFVVPSLTLSDVDDIYEVRFLIEPAALRRVAELTTDPGVRAPIEEALAAAEAAFRAGDADAFREANIRFRNAWKDLVPNRRLVRAIEQYADHMMRIRALTLGDAEDPRHRHQGPAAHRRRTGRRRRRSGGCRHARPPRRGEARLHHCHRA
ncbi:MAG: FCD domain-containing protein [Rhodocyclaceae bacterium]|nr:FCD domain-containing protein [Rhodocyclaceae bacterium]